MFNPLYFFRVWEFWGKRYIPVVFHPFFWSTWKAWGHKGANLDDGDDKDKWEYKSLTHPWLKWTYEDIEICNLYCMCIPCVYLWVVVICFFSPSWGISPLKATDQDILLYAVNTMYMQKDMRIRAFKGWAVFKQLRATCNGPYSNSNKIASCMPFCNTWSAACLLTVARNFYYWWTKYCAIQDG